MENLKSILCRMLKDDLKDTIDVEKYMKECIDSKETIELMMMLNNSFIIN